MNDPTSTVGEDTEESAPTCASCGETIVNEPTHRVLTSVENGQVSAEHFCDEDCRAAFVG
ncbi:hypothetical protein MUK72_04420 [Halococcus dombrowskii]|uniref:Small CPxCG-related zinc finger protein n=1 Tax=Halococcus dombrowskii TaxID=179637 RepID=A0AAV3SJK3_HALDO|nr:hypothetical protein [Halococcus dombrowskii]UOO95954.1 hypothetical protein MUK72_04420 [Halococcus dombrowskii]